MSDSPPADGGTHLVPRAPIDVFVAEFAGPPRPSTVVVSNAEESVVAALVQDVGSVMDAKMDLIMRAISQQKKGVMDKIDAKSLVMQETKAFTDKLAARTESALKMTDESSARMLAQISEFSGSSGGAASAAPPHVSPTLADAAFQTLHINLLFTTEWPLVLETSAALWQLYGCPRV